MIGIQPKGSLTNLYHATDYPELITQGSSPKTTYDYAGEKVIDTPGKYTFATPSYNTAGQFGDTVLRGQIDTESFNKGIQTYPYKGYRTVPGVASNYDLHEPQVLLKSQDAYDIFKGGKIGSAAPRYDFGPFHGIVSPDEMQTNIPKQSVTYQGTADDIPFYGTRKNLEQAILPLKKGASIAARFANRLNPATAIAATVDNVRRGNYLGAGGSALSILPRALGLAGVGLDLAANTDYIRDAGVVDEDPELMQAMQNAIQTPTPYGTGVLPPSVAQRERNVLLDDDIRRGMLMHKARHTYGTKGVPFLEKFIPSGLRTSPQSTFPSFDPELQAATGWTEPEMNAALHAAGRTAYGGLLSPLIRTGTEFYTSTLDRPKDDEATPDLDESNVLKADDIRDMWADEYSQELYDTGITTLQEMLDKGIARPSDFSAGRNLPNEPYTFRPTVVPDLSAIGINPTPDYTWQEILGVQSDLPGTVAPARRAFNVDEFGNRASLARFTEPEVDTDDFIRENLIEAVAPAPEVAPTVTRSQPGPGGPRSPEPERDRTPKPKPKPRTQKSRKKPPRKKPTKKALIADTKKKSKAVTVAKVTHKKAQDRTDALVNRIIAESGKSRDKLDYDDKKTIARSQSVADRKKKEVQAASRAANIARENSLKAIMGSQNYSAYQARGRK